MPQPKIQTSWYHGDKTEAERANTLQLVLSSQKLLDKLHQIVYNMYTSVESTQKTDYNSPSWSHLQAHKNGEREVLGKILALLEIKEH